MIKTIDHIINIDLVKKINMNKSINIKKNDTNSHKFVINIFDNSVPYNLTGSTARIYFEKADKTTVFADCTIDNALNGKISYLLTTQTVSYPGEVATEVTIYGTGGEILTSITFDFTVKDTVRNDAAIESTSEFTALTNALNAVNDAVGSLPTVAALNIDLQSNIITGDALKTDLETNIVTGNTLKGILESDILTAEEKIVALESVIATADLTTYASKGSVDSVVASLAEITTISQHTLYVRSNGNDNNDGLTVGSPLLTIQKAFDLLQTTYLYQVNIDQWTIDIGAGTFDGGIINKAMYPANRIVIKGTVDGSNIPTTIINGATSALDSGIAINAQNYLEFRNLKFINWVLSSTSSGIACSHFVNFYCNNVHTDNITWAGINANYHCRFYVEGGIINNCGTGIRAYDTSHFTIGYKGSVAKRVLITNCAIGIEPRNASQGHIDYADIDLCPIGVYCYNSARFHMLGSSVTNSSGHGIRLDTGATWLNSTVIPNVFSGNLVNEIRYGYSTELGDGRNVIYDKAENQYIFKGDSNANNLGNSNCRMLIASSGISGLNIQSGDSDSCFLYLGTKTSSSKHGFSVSNTSNYLQTRVNNVNITRHQSTEFRAETDNTINLGNASFRWKEIFSATGTINTSDRSEKQQISEISDELLDAWSDVNFCRFKFNDSVNLKGNEARFHFGLIAQDIFEAFERHNINAFEYGLLCYNEWEDTYEKNEKGENILVLEKGSRWGIRADECQFLEMALMRRELNRLKNL